MNRLPPEIDGCLPTAPCRPTLPGDAAAARPKLPPRAIDEPELDLTDLSEPEREELARAYPAW